MNQRNQTKVNEPRKQREIK